LTQEEYWGQRAKATTLTELRNDRTRAVFVAFEREPNIEQPLREQEAYSEDETVVMVFHPDGTRTYYARMAWV
jgi:hypothetical protein